MQSRSGSEMGRDSEMGRESGRETVSVLVSELAMELAVAWATDAAWAAGSSTAPVRKMLQRLGPLCSVSVPSNGSSNDGRAAPTDTVREPATA